MELEPIIGLELHIEMKTKSKMFSSSAVSFGGVPNTHIDPFDMAFPGTLPLVNKQAVINGIRMANALHMTIDNELWFDRKNYFYSDLPKGYQITQEKRPLGRKGYLNINGRRIDIERLHLEEDTCKQLHFQDYSLLDYNRAGIPLIEIVSKPIIKDGEEAMRFVEEIRSIASFLDVSDGKMEEGSLRCDVNVSIHEKGQQSLGVKVEIKNINTLKNIKHAIDFEINRQEELVNKGKRIIQETRRYDEKKKETIPMRLKIDSIDYKTFIDPNIIPIKLSEDFIKSAIETSNELASQRFERYQAMGLNDYDASLLLNNKDVSDYYDNVIKLGANPKITANWVNVDIQAYLKKTNTDIKDFPIKPDRLSQLIQLLMKNEISNKQVRDIFTVMLGSNKEPSEILKETGNALINEEKTLLNLVGEVLDNNPQIITDYKNGKDKVVGYVVGVIMQKTKGQANPSLTNRLVKEELQRR